MLTKSNHKLLTLACGLCWHEPINNSCNSIADRVITYCKHCLVENPTHHTFTSADDWELVLEKVIVPYKTAFHEWFKKKIENCHYVSGFEHWLTLSIEERMDLVVEFVEANLGLFKAIIEQEEK